VSDESIRKIVIAARLVAAGTVAFQSVMFLRHAHGRLEQIIGAAGLIAIGLLIAAVSARRPSST
jgi:hypothetical protein